MNAITGPLGRRLAAAAVVVFALAGGIAYAAIPDTGTGVYHACMFRNFGSIRIIDPDRQHCNALFEKEITFNQKGQQGPPGLNGASPTVAQLSATDTHCPAGGAAITDALGSTAYVCNGANGANGTNGTNGADGRSFSGTFTSPDGRYSLSVTNDGVEIVGADAKISLPSSGGVTVASNSSFTVKGDRTEMVGSNGTITINGDRTEVVGNGSGLLTVQGDRTEMVSGNQRITVKGDRTEVVGGGPLTVRADSGVSIDSPLVGINGGTACMPVARVGDSIQVFGGGSPFGDITSGSPTVCIG